MLAGQVANLARGRVGTVTYSRGVVGVKVGCRKGAVARLGDRLGVDVVAERALVLGEVVKVDFENDAEAIDARGGGDGGYNVRF